jgi:AcrR family transcriptional regulator
LSKNTVVTAKEAVPLGEQRPRRRDPDRKERILEASAELIASRGYHAVSLADIGAAAGIVGSGIYRHFPSKAAVLAALLAKVMDSLESAAADIAATFDDDREALTALVRHHVRVTVIDQPLMGVYHSETDNLAEDDLRRLRRMQRHYIEEWVSVVSPLRPDLADGEVRLTVHAAIGAIQSILFHNSGLPQERLVELLDTMAHACLGVPPAEGVAPWPLDESGAHLSESPVS